MLPFYTGVCRLSTLLFRHSYKIKADFVCAFFIYDFWSAPIKNIKHRLTVVSFAGLDIIITKNLFNIILALLSILFTFFYILHLNLSYGTPKVSNFEIFRTFLNEGPFGPLTPAGFLKQVPKGPVVSQI